MLLMEVYNTKNQICFSFILKLFHIKVLIVFFSYLELSLEADPLNVSK